MRVVNAHSVFLGFMVDSGILGLFLRLSFLPGLLIALLFCPFFFHFLVFLGTFDDEVDFGVLERTCNLGPLINLV